MIGVDWFEPPRKAVERKYLPGVTGAAEVGKPGEDSECSRQRQSKLFEADCNLGGENGPRRRAENPNVMRRVSLQQFLVNRDHVVNRGRKRILRRETIVDRDDFNLRQVGYGDALDQRP